MTTHRTPSTHQAPSPHDDRAPTYHRLATKLALLGTLAFPSLAEAQEGREQSTRDVILTIPDYEGADGIVDYVSVSSSKSADRNAAHLEPALALYSNPTPIEGLAPVIFRKEVGEEKTLYDLKVLFYNEQYRDTFARKQAAEYFEREAEVRAGEQPAAEPKLQTTTSRRIFTTVLSYVDGPMLAEGRTIYLPQSDWDTPHPIFQRLTLEVMNGDVPEFESLLQSGRAVFRYETERETARGAQIEVTGNIAWEVRNRIENDLELVRTDREEVRPLTADLRNQLDGSIRELVQKSVRIEGDPTLVLSIVPLVSDGVMEHLVAERSGQELLQEFFRVQSDFRNALSSHLIAEMARANEEQQETDTKVTYALQENKQVRGRESSVGGGFGANIYAVQVKFEGSRTRSDQQIISTLNGWTKEQGVRWTRGTAQDTYLPASIDVVNLGAVDLAVQKGYQSAMSVVENARLSNGVPVFRPATFTTDDIGALEASEEVEVLRLREAARAEAAEAALPATILQEIDRDIRQEELAVQEALTGVLSVLHSLPSTGDTLAKLPELVRGCQQLLNDPTHRAAVQTQLEAALRLKPKGAEQVATLISEGQLTPREIQYTDPRVIRAEGELAQSIRDRAELEQVSAKLTAHREHNDAEMAALIAYSRELTALQQALYRLASISDAQVTRVYAEERVAFLKQMSEDQYRHFKSEYDRKYQEFCEKNPMKEDLDYIRTHVGRTPGFAYLNGQITFTVGPRPLLNALVPLTKYQGHPALSDAAGRCCSRLNQYINRFGDGNR